jgi:hypothetical protein
MHISNSEHASLSKAKRKRVALPAASTQSSTAGMLECSVQPQEMSSWGILGAPCWAGGSFAGMRRLRSRSASVGGIG